MSGLKRVAMDKLQNPVRAAAEVYLTITTKDQKIRNAAYMVWNYLERELTKRRAKGGYTMRGIEVYDDGLGYTIILGGRDVYAMSTHPLDLQGVNQYVGTMAELPGARDGQAVPFDKLPDAVKEAIKQRWEEHWKGGSK